MKLSVGRTNDWYLIWYVNKIYKIIVIASGSFVYAYNWSHNFISASNCGVLITLVHFLPLLFAVDESHF